jgi:hypothetical protein
VRSHASLKLTEERAFHLFETEPVNTYSVISERPIHEIVDCFKLDYPRRKVASALERGGLYVIRFSEPHKARNCPLIIKKEW